MPAQKPNRKFMKAKDAAAELGVTENTIYRYMDRGELQFLWIGGRRRLTRELFEAFIAENTMTGPLTDE